MNTSKLSLYVFIAFLLAFVGFSSNAIAQEDKTLLNSDAKIGFYLNPYTQISPVAGETAAFFGVRGAVTLQKKFAVGGLYQFSVNQIRPSTETDDRLYYDVQQFGGFIEYTLNPTNAFHLTFPLAIGGGEIQADWRDGFEDLDDNDNFGEATFFFVEPRVEGELNLHRFVRLHAGVGYRFVGDISYRTLENNAMRGISATIGIKLGIF
ncbi:hypothetical protein [Hugenholtzia roseola]|uniref:hypothetical protein n=1 Tax=Hugenholtzia roseola TaxID=1002 RepID=UPI00041C23AD|nr:hypothetical protein [Hugenholtzia roseola]